MDGRYDPVTPTGARFCEARVWYIFQQLAEPTDFDAEYYLPYAQGFNLTRRMPLWVRPDWLSAQHASAHHGARPHRYAQSAGSRGRTCMQPSRPSTRAAGSIRRLT